MTATGRLPARSGKADADVRIAGRHGLGFADARALADLARDPAHAEQLAVTYHRAAPDNLVTITDPEARRQAWRRAMSLARSRDRTPPPDR